MSQFHVLSAAVAARFADLSKGELFTVDIDGDALYQAYQDAFPAGTNEVFRVAREHECSTCRNFIRNLGNVVSIRSGFIETVWDGMAELPEPYNWVAESLSVLVGAAKITGVFRSEQPKYGAETTREPGINGALDITWNHFHGKVASTHYAGDKAATRIGEAAAIAQVLGRGLRELVPDDLDTVIELVEAKSLYRGAEKLHLLTGFRELMTQFRSLNSPREQELFIWSNLAHPAARFRSDVIGTLLIDLASGVPLEDAVDTFGKKMDPENYKRTTSIVTPRMKEQALQTIVDLGLEPALARRFARIEDVSVNSILFVDNSVRGKMKDALADLLDSTVTAPAPKVDASKATDISIEDFLATVVPKASSMDVFVKNSQQTNFVSLTAPVHPDAPRLFKWDNGFGWSYAGNIADSSLRDKVAALGGRVDGVLRFTHTWNYDARNASLMDLHVFMPGSGRHQDGCHDSYPSGQRVGWNERKDRLSGGVQDVDYTGAAPEGYVPVENITFPDMARLKEGEYVFKIHNWKLREPTKGGFRAEIEFGGQIFQYDHPAPLKHKEWITLAVVTLKAGEFTIEHKHPTTTMSQEKWGVKTEQFTKVDTLMVSPNFWDGQAVGNKHYIFALEGCKNPEPTRGIYNEFLRADLHDHRKVFEVLGAKTMCEPTDTQISGVGFSSTRGDKVLIRVISKTDRRVYNVQF